MRKKEDTSFDYFGYGLYAFAILGVELIILILSKNLFNFNRIYNIKENIFHLIITSIIWTVLGLILFKKIPKENTSLNKNNFIFAFVFLLLSIIYTSYIWKGFKPIIEFNNLGLLNFIFQYIYYSIEAFILTLIITFGELAFGKKSKILPVGGLFLALTWGLMHILLQDFKTGIYCVFLSILFGFIYKSLNGNLKYTYIFIALAFLI